MVGGSVATKGTDSLQFINDLTADSIRMDSEAYRAILSVQTQTKAIKLTGQHFTVQMDNDPKHTMKATQEFLKVKTWHKWPNESPDLQPVELQLTSG